MTENRGVVALRNLKTDWVYLFYSEDIKKDCVDIMLDNKGRLEACRLVEKSLYN